MTTRTSLVHYPYLMRVTHLLAAMTCVVAHAAALPTAFAATAEQPASVAPAKKAAVEVGDLLQATEDVSLDEAVIRKGSKITVSKKSKAAGRVFLDVALADGHVVRQVPLANIMKSFERVDD